MLYQWGRKEPFTFATSSLYNEGGVTYYGKYPVKIYNGKRELIYQEDIGKDNSGKTPAGGLIIPNSLASSMMEAIKHPNVFYFIWNQSVINQIGHSKELWDYYWTSYSRGIDGHSSWNLSVINKPKWHNTYLDGYIVLRSKSIYDPCPYGYRTVTNGTYNEFNSNLGWIYSSYTGGIDWSTTKTISWFVPVGSKRNVFYEVGNWITLLTSVIATRYTMYSFCTNGKAVQSSRSNLSQSIGFSVRCIEDATVKAV